MPDSQGLPLIVFPNEYQGGTNEWPPTTEPTGIACSMGAVYGQHPVDAHAVQYVLPGTSPGDRHYRVNKAALPAMKEEGIEPLLAWVLLDLDPGKDNPTMPEGMDDRADWVEGKVPFGMGWYTTRKGVRLFARLDTPIPVTLAEDWLSMLVAAIKKESGLAADPNTMDWTRVMRLACVMRDGVQLVSEFDTPSGPLDWTPPRQPKPSEAVARGFAGSDEMDSWPPPSDHMWVAVGEAPALAGGLAYTMQQGKPLAEQGDRNATAFTVTHSLAARLSSHDGVTPAAEVWSFIAESVRADTSHGAVTEEQAWRMCEEASSKEAGKYPQAPLRTPPGKVPAPIPGGDDGGDEDDAADQGPATASHLIVYKASSYWVWDETLGCYDATPVAGPQLGARLSQLCPTQASGRHVTTSGGVKGLSSILRLIPSMPLSRVAYKVGAATTHLEGDTLITPVAVEQAQPAYHQEVHDWLVALGGEQLLDWLSTVPRMSQPTSALYLQGPPGIGKGMLANGLGAIYQSQPINAEQGSADFNGAMLDCPIVFADETYTAKGKDLSAEFRKLVGDTQHSVSQKYMPDAKLLGCPRLIICANNPNAIKFPEHMNLSADDIQAIADRITYIKADSSALELLGDEDSSWKTTKDWVWMGNDTSKMIPGLIAQHVLWLRDNRHPVGGRFLFSGKRTAWHDEMLIVHYRNAARTLEVIACTLASGADMPREGDHLLINLSSLVHSWPQHSTASFNPDRSWLATVLGAISDGEVTRDGSTRFLVPISHVTTIASKFHIDMRAAKARLSSLTLV